MSGETDIVILLRQMQPSLNEGEYVFCSVTDTGEKYQNLAIGTFREKEGLTLIINKTIADDLHLPYQFVSSWITLTVHSSLEAVGLTAAFSTALSNAGISCNVVAGFYHDHLFVPKKDAGKAMQVLQNIRNTAGSV